MTKTTLLNERVIDSELIDDDAMGSSQIRRSVQPVSLGVLDNASYKPISTIARASRKKTLESMFDVPVTLIFEVGRTKITIKQLMELCEGSCIELRNVSVDSIDVRINETIVAQAETIALQQRYGIRFGEVAMFNATELEK